MNHYYGNPSLPVLRQQSHPECFVCGPANGHGLGLEFRPAADGAVEAAFACEPVFAGYPGMLHGGIICSLLDGAMTNCMFAHGLAAVWDALPDRCVPCHVGAQFEFNLSTLSTIGA